MTPDADEEAGAYALAAATIAGSLAATLMGKGLLTREEGDAVFRTAESLLRRTHPDAADIVRSMFMDGEDNASLQ